MKLMQAIKRIKSAMAVFGLIALFFIFRPGGLVTVATAERV
jgi:hypothetical protein